MAGLKHDISQEHYFHLESEDVVPSITMALRDLKRPVKMAPATVHIVFRKNQDQTWETIVVSVYGHRIHPTLREWICERYIDGEDFKESMPDWVATLVRGAHPGA